LGKGITWTRKENVSEDAKEAWQKKKYGKPKRSRNKRGGKKVREYREMMEKNLEEEAVNDEEEANNEAMEGEGDEEESLDQEEEGVNDQEEAKDEEEEEYSQMNVTRPASPVYPPFGAGTPTDLNGMGIVVPQFRAPHTV
jgi:hypothetical protein